MYTALIIIGSVLGLLIVGLLGWLATLPSAFQVTRSRKILASPAALYEAIRDFEHWRDWSPWLIHEPTTSVECSPNFRDVGGWHLWKGQHVGSGRITHEKFVENQSIDQGLEFLSPQRSQSHVVWSFKAVGDETEVTWSMSGKLPFFFRWVGLMMDGMIGKDFEFGLARLAMYVGDSRDPLDLSFDEVVDVPSEHYVSLSYAGSIAGMPEAMREGFTKLLETARARNIPMTGGPLALYHEFRPKKDFVRCEMAIPVASPVTLEGFGSGQTPGGRYLRTVLRGNYTQMAFAWHGAFGHARMLKLKVKHGQPKIERYVTDPDECAGLDLVTQIDLPVAG